MTSPLRAVLIAGPTAVGKSAFACEIAEPLHGVIINADSMQVYQDWQVLTDRPGTAITSRIPHRLYGHISIRETYSVGHWLTDVKLALAEAADSGRLPIIVGGTGIYFMALTEGLAPMPESTTELRDEVAAWIESEGLPSVAAELRRHDPATAAKLDLRNPRRVARAWEVLRTTGMGLAGWQEQTAPPLLPLSTTEPILLSRPRDELVQRIDHRVEHIFAGGALEEARAVHKLDLSTRLPGLQPLGARELFAYLDGEVTWEVALTQTQVATRQYAKRQATWFRRRMRNWQSIALDGSAIVPTIERVRDCMGLPANS